MIKLTELESKGLSLTNIAGNSLFYVVQGGVSYAVRWSTIAALVNTGNNNNPGPTVSDGPEEIQLNVSATFTITGDSLLEKVVIVPAASGNIKIGTSSGGGEIFDFSVSSGNVAVLDIDKFFNSETLLYISGSDARLLLYIR